MTRALRMALDALVLVLFLTFALRLMAAGAVTLFPGVIGQ